MAITTSTALALGLAAAGAGANYYNTRQVGKRQDREAAAGIRAQGARQREADARVNALVDQQAQSSPAAAQADVLGQYMRQLQAGAGGASRGIAQVGNVSAAAQEQAADASLGVSDYGKMIAGLMSAMDAPGLQRREEAIRAARTGSDIERIANFAGGDQFLTQMRLDGIRRNPWLDAFSALAGGAAQGMAGGWGTGKMTKTGGGPGKTKTGGNRKGGY